MRCRPCKNKLQAEDFAAWDEESKKIKAEQNKLWRENNPDKTRKHDIMKRCRKAGLLSEAEHIIQLSTIQEHCLICKRHKDICGVLHVDHDHTTNKFRGLICGNCNVMLGHAKDNITTLQSAIEYLSARNPGS